MEAISKEGLEALSMNNRAKAKKIEMKALSALSLSLSDEVLR